MDSEAGQSLDKFKNIIEDASVLLIITSIVCVFGILIGLLTFICRSPKVRPLLLKIKNKIFFNMFIKAFMTAFLELSLANWTALDQALSNDTPFVSSSP